MHNERVDSGRSVFARRTWMTLLVTMLLGVAVGVPIAAADPTGTWLYAASVALGLGGTVVALSPQLVTAAGQSRLLRWIVETLDAIGLVPTTHYAHSGRPHMRGFSERDALVLAVVSAALGTVALLVSSVSLAAFAALGAGLAYAERWTDEGERF